MTQCKALFPLKGFSVSWVLHHFSPDSYLSSMKTSPALCSVLHVDIFLSGSRVWRVVFHLYDLSTACQNWWRFPLCFRRSSSNASVTAATKLICVPVSSQGTRPGSTALAFPPLLCLRQQDSLILRRSLSGLFSSPGQSSKPSIIFFRFQPLVPSAGCLSCPFDPPDWLVVLKGAETPGACSALAFASPKLGILKLFSGNVPLAEPRAWPPLGLHIAFPCSHPPL